MWRSTLRGDETGLDSEEEDELVCPMAAAAATEIIKMTRTILRMLDLATLKRFPETIAIGCRTS